MIKAQDGANLRRNDSSSLPPPPVSLTLSISAPLSFYPSLLVPSTSKKKKKMERNRKLIETTLLNE